MIRNFLNRVEHRFEFPGLGISSESSLSVLGIFNYQSQCSIENNVVIIINGSLTFGQGIRLRSGTEINGTNVVIGSFTRLEKHARIFGEVQIGSFTLVGANFYASARAHEFKLSPHNLINDQDEMVDKISQQKKIYIGEDCWIGINVFVAPGVTIGKGCVVGANSTVLTDLPPYSVAMGQPARTISKRLAFNPPEALSAEERNIPYFYEGFDNRKCSIQGSMKALAENLTLCLLLEGKSKLILDVEGVNKIWVSNREYSLPNAARTTIEASLEQTNNVFLPLRIPNDAIDNFRIYGAKTF